MSTFNPAVYYKQSDPRWSGNHLGESSETMGRKGCTTSVNARIASNVVQQDITPGALNEYANTHNGYTTDGLFIWECLIKFCRLYGKTLKYLGRGGYLSPYRPLARYIQRVVLVKTSSGAIYKHFVGVQPGGMCYDPLTGSSHKIAGWPNWTPTNDYRYLR